ncbi:MAG: hypothetical protein ACLVB5_09625 [Christensenellales bacterium]
MQGAVAREEIELSFKRYILEKTEAFAHEPMEDVYRVNLLGQMLDRYDELRQKGLSGDAALQRTTADYADIPARMRREGFEEAGARWTEARWPQMTEEEAADYVKQSDALRFAQEIPTGTAALCSACDRAPMMLLVALMSAFGRPDVGGMLGCVNMFVMIGMGVYCLVTAKKPENRSRIRSGKSPTCRRVPAQKADGAQGTRRREGAAQKGPRLRAAGGVRVRRSSPGALALAMRWRLCWQQPVRDSAAWSAMAF